MDGPSFTITRAELYRRVWEVPFKRLIVEFGTTYDILRRVADELDVPRPPSGYWKKHAAGTAGHPPPLPELEPGRRSAQQVLRIDAVREEALDKQRRLGAVLGDLRMPSKLTHAHPFVRGWAAERRRHERHTVRQSTLDSSFYPPSETDNRRHRILQALLPALERQGAILTAEHDEGTIEARFVGATIAFRLREKLKQVRHPLPKEELRQPWNTPNSYHIELHPTGLLSFKIETYTKVGWRTWEDDRGGLLEGRLQEIAVTILMARDDVIEAAREDRVRHEQQMECEQRNRAAAEVRQREEARWTGFVELSRRSDEAAHLRRFLGRLESADLPLQDLYGDRTVAEWLAWAHDRIERLDPLSAGAEGAIAALAQIGIQTAGSNRPNHLDSKFT